MTYVPVTIEEVLGDRTPIRGEADDLTDVSHHLWCVEGNATSYGVSVRFAAQELLTLQSRAVTTLREKLYERLMPGSDLVEASARAAKASVDCYASEIETIHRRARRVVEEGHEALATIRRQSREIADILLVIGVRQHYSWNERVPTEIPSAANLVFAEQASNWQFQQHVIQQGFAWHWKRSAVRWHDALAAIEKVERQWSVLLIEREEAEGRLLEALRETRVGQLLQIGETARISVDEVVAFVVAGEMHGNAPVLPETQSLEIEALLALGLTPEQLAVAWRSEDFTVAHIAALPPEALAHIGSLDGIPAWVRDAASTSLLHFAIIEPRKAYELLGFTETDMSLMEFREQTFELHRVWREAGIASRKLGHGYSVQLIGLGNHDGAFTAAISHGDLDRAEYIGLNVAGMFSGVESIGNDASAAQSILSEALKEDVARSYAMVTWAGYRSPNLGTVNGMARAEAGAQELADFIEGTQLSRAADNQAISNFTLFGHSYGSTTAAEALKIISNDHRIDDFVVYGSAGFANGTVLADLRVDEVYAVHGPGDNLAWAGRTAVSAHSVNPIDMPGVTKFSGYSGDEFLRVSSHDMFTKDDSASIGNWLGNVGYTTPGTKTVKTMGEILATGRLRQ